MEIVNPLLEALKLPGRTFQLPSKGALYRNGEVSSPEGEVHVYPMSTLTEISLKTPDLLYNGKALERVFAECVPDIKKPLDLFSRDVDALMFFLRLVTYGPHFEINVTHTCKDAKQHSYVVDIEKMVMEMKSLDPTALNQFSVTLPNGQVVRLRSLTLRNMIKLFELNAGKTDLTPAQLEELVTANLLSLIESVDGTTDVKLLEEWVRRISTPIKDRISEAIERISSWGPANTTMLKCRDCGQQMEVELPLSPVAFFAA